MNMSEITRSVNERAPALPKLLDYYVKNPDEFKAKFKNSRKDHRPLHLENSSLFFKFNECILFEHPYNVYKTRKYLFISIYGTFSHLVRNFIVERFFVLLASLITTG